MSWKTAVGIATIVTSALGVNYNIESITHKQNVLAGCIAKTPFSLEREICGNTYIDLEMYKHSAAILIPFSAAFAPSIERFEKKYEPLEQNPFYDDRRSNDGRIIYRT